MEQRDQMPQGTSVGGDSVNIFLSSLYLHLNSANLPFRCKFSAVQKEVNPFIQCFTRSRPENKDTVEKVHLSKHGQQLMMDIRDREQRKKATLATDVCAVVISIVQAPLSTFHDGSQPL